MNGQTTKQPHKKSIYIMTEVSSLLMNEVQLSSSSSSSQLLSSGSSRTDKHIYYYCDENNNNNDNTFSNGSNYTRRNNDITTTTTTTTGVIPTASYTDTILNIMKTCLGTGCLALPYACQQGGIIIYSIGLVIIAVWNYIVMILLIDCLHYIPVTTTTATTTTTSVVVSTVSSQQQERRQRNQKTRKTDEKDCHYTSIDRETSDDDDGNTDTLPVDSTDVQPPPPPPPPPPPVVVGNSTMGIVAWYSFGTLGVQVLNGTIVLLFLGIITAYVAAVITFVSDTQFTTRNRWYDAIIMGTIMGTIAAVVPDIGYLSRISRIGLVVLFLAFVAIAGYGITVRAVSYSTITEGTDTPSIFSNINLVKVLWPMSVNGISHYYGIAVFGYGAVPLTFNFQESMREPNRIVSAIGTSIALVALSNVVLGVGLYILFPYLTTDILHELPSTGIIPSTIRLAMVGTIIATAPLLIVPCSELLYGGRWIHNTVHAPVFRRVIFRYGIVALCVTVAVSLPSFVEVLALVGCFCVALVSFCVPPTLHLRLLWSAHMRRTKQQMPGKNVHESFPIQCVMFDVLLLVLGIVTTIISTACTLTK